jgi:hypothetical protein
VGVGWNRSLMDWESLGPRCCRSWVPDGPGGLWESGSAGGPGVKRPLMVVESLG